MRNAYFVHRAIGDVQEDLVLAWELTAPADYPGLPWYVRATHRDFQWFLDARCALCQVIIRGLAWLGV